MPVKGRILVIDDDHNFLEFTRIVLESGDYEVYTEDSASDGLSAVRKIKPCLVILDVMMSYCLDGFGVLREISNDPELGDISLILVSAIVDRDEVIQSSTGEFNYDRFMSKPILPRDLLSVVAELLEEGNSGKIVGF